MFLEISRPDADFNSSLILFSWMCHHQSLSARCYPSGVSYFMLLSPYFRHLIQPSCSEAYYLLSDFVFSVFTPYYSEVVLYSMAELTKRNEDGISILFYLQKIYPGMLAL